MLFVLSSCAFTDVLPTTASKNAIKSITQSYLRGWEYSLKAGFSIGGTAPLPLPEEIRKIDSYVPSMTISIEGNATKWLDEKKLWGLTLGLRLETKNMTTEATVKNYGMKIINTNGGEDGDSADQPVSG